MARLPHNVEKSIFRPGTYRIYDGRGQVWTATRSHAGSGKVTWHARPAPSNPSANLGVTRTGDTLTALAASLAARVAPRVVEPF